MRICVHVYDERTLLSDLILEIRGYRFKTQDQINKYTRHRRIEGIATPTAYSSRQGCNLCCVKVVRCVTCLDYTFSFPPIHFSLLYLHLLSSFTSPCCDVRFLAGKLPHLLINIRLHRSLDTSTSIPPRKGIFKQTIIMPGQFWNSWVLWEKMCFVSETMQDRK